MPDDRPPAAIEARVAGPEDADAVAETLALAFYEDPVWGLGLCRSRAAARPADGATGGC